MFISPETYHFLEGLPQIGITLLLGGFALWVLCIKPRNRLAWDQVAHLVEPAFSKIKERNVIFISVKGHPDRNAGPAYRKLFNAYYKLNPQTGPGSPLARWKFGAASIPERSKIPPMDEWTVTYALAISKKMKAGAEKATLLPEIKVATWHAGEVAELLHEGPYEAKFGTVFKLQNFIKEEGYEIVGEHEEEFVYGPGNFLRGNPKTYLTIIRYLVRATPEAAAKREKAKEESNAGREIEGEEDDGEEDNGGWVIENEEEEDGHGGSMQDEDEDEEEERDGAEDEEEEEEGEEEGTGEEEEQVEKKKTK